MHGRDSSYVRYLSSYGVGFFADDWQEQQKHYDDGYKTWTGKARTQLRKFKASPIKLLERELFKDIDIVLERNFKAPEVAIAILNCLTMNQQADCINSTLFQKLMLDYLLSAECVEVMKQTSFDPTKGFQFAKILRYFQTYTEQLNRVQSIVDCDSKT